MEAIGITHNPFAELGEKSFCLECNVHGCVCYPPNNAPPTSLAANAEYVRKSGRGRKNNSHKLLIVLHTRGQRKYGWN